MIMFFLCCDHLEVKKVPMQFSVSRRGIPSRRSQDFKTVELGWLLLGKRVKRENRKVLGT